MWPWSALPVLSKPSIATKLRFEPDYIETHVPRLRYALLPTVERETYRSFLWFFYNPGRFCGRLDCYPFQCTSNTIKGQSHCPRNCVKKSENVRILSWGWCSSWDILEGMFPGFCTYFLIRNEWTECRVWMAVSSRVTNPKLLADFD